MPKLHLKNSKGFTIVEMLVTMVMTIILLAAAIYTFTKQERVLREENAHAGIRNQGRIAMTALAEDLREAGYGLPPGHSLLSRDAVGVTAATATSITFMADLTNTNTMLAADATIGDGTITVENIAPNGNAFADGDTISIFDVNTPCHYEIATINGTPAGNTITLTSGLTGQNVCTASTDDYEVSDGIIIHKIDTVVYSYNSGLKAIGRMENGGAAIPLIGNVSAFNFSYYDVDGNALTTLPLSAADLGNLRRVEVNVTVQDQTQQQWTQVFNTDVNLRNMGT